MTDVQVRAAVKAQKADAKRYLLTYRGVQYLKSQSRWEPERMPTQANNIGTSGVNRRNGLRNPWPGKRGCLTELVRRGFDGPRSFEGEGTIYWCPLASYERQPLGGHPDAG